ncbi:MAG: hypothetical protein NTZ24_13845 [Deltaproteobacteria bacterium]|nr:hypothetical protein [Deltaproteobacteria bacterium]
MSRKIITGMLLILMLCLTGCATIMSHGPQTLSILSQPDGADCEIVDVTTKTSIAKVKTPYTATLERGAGYFLKKYYDIKITKDGYIPEYITITPQLSGWYFANLLFGGGIGAIIVDPLTGAMWTFCEKDVRFKLYPDTTEGRAARAADERARAEAKAKEERGQQAKQAL